MMESSNGADMQISTSDDQNEYGNTDGSEANKKCFSQIQSRKFWAPLVASTCRLCPSMDLVVFGLETPSSSTPPRATALSLHRTVSWQKLSTLADFDSVDASQEESSGGVSHVAWSPDGRLLALALLSAKVMLYHVEAMVSSPSSMAGEDNPQEGRLCVMSVADADEIVGLTWAHVGRPHPQWSLTDWEQEEEVFWRYRSRYLDRSTALLPPSDYHWHEHRAEGKSAVNTTLPTCKTPLSILCVSTKEGGLHLYLHGRYRILTLPTTSTLSQSVVSSPSLTHLWVHSKENLLSLYSIPALAYYRYNLQTISSLCCSVTCHLESIRQHAMELVASYKSSLKPLDSKLEGLVRLLKNYGVEMDARSVLHKYILVGHTSSNLSNAMDQFFTSVAMNDQLIQRLERSLQASVANVEQLARTGLLSPARALAFNVGELHGLARHSSLLSEKAAHTLEEACSILLISVECTLTQLIEARFRLRDLVSWLRSTGSEIKARGTAANSAQRENAKKRRVPKATVQRMLSYLQEGSVQSSSITETLLGIPLVDLLHEHPSYVASRSPSPTSVLSSESKRSEKKTPTVLYATQCSEEAAAKVFEHPRTFLSRSVHRIDFVLPRENLPVAIHTRVGSDGSEGEESDSDDKKSKGGFFSPQAIGKSGCMTLDCRQWTVIAKAGSSSTNTYNSVYLYVVPLGWKQSTIDPEDVDDPFLLNEVPFYLVAEALLPPLCSVVDICFYGDDGKSSLSSGADSGTGQEGRQALGLLVSRLGQSGKEASVEIWMVQYDSIIFKMIDLEQQQDCTQVFFDNSCVDSQCQVFIQPLSASQDYEELDLDQGIVFAKTRHITSQDSSKTGSSKLVLSGSRGIGGVFSSAKGVTTLDLFDLEEDEEDEDSENQSMEG